LQRQQQEQAVQKQEELSYVPSSGKGLSSDRQVGLKSKRENEEADDLEWEEAVPTGNCLFYVALFLCYIYVAVANILRSHI